MADMADIERLGVKQARGIAHQALLVCAYESTSTTDVRNLEESATSRTSGKGIWEIAG
jgi:hypothetical protein